MNQGKLIYSGKAKDLYETEREDQLLVVYKDQTTAGNGAKKEQIKGKGVMNQEISSLIFNYLKERGIATHLVQSDQVGREVVKKMKMFPLEVVLRNVAAGSIVKRLGVSEGTEFPLGMVEFFYKSDALNDPFLNDENIYFLGLATSEDLETIKKLTRKINQELSSLFEKIGLILVDFKLEFGKTETGEILLGDEFSPDNARLWDKDTHQSFDKDIFRKDEGDMMPYYQEVRDRLEKVLSSETHSK